MRPRLLIRIPIFLLAGAATTWLVAWGLAFRTIEDRGTRFYAKVGSDGAITTVPVSLGGPREIIVTRFESAGALLIEGTVYGDSFPMLAGTAVPWFGTKASTLSAIAPSWAQSAATPCVANLDAWPTGSHTDTREVDARGWPFLALYSVDGWGKSQSRERSGGFAVTEPRERVVDPTISTFFRFRSDSPVILPCLPIWRGLLADTAIFGAAWWAVFLIPAGLRRALRRKKGVCPRCGYDLRGLPAGTTCPECGSDSAVQVARASGP